MFKSLKGLTVRFLPIFSTHTIRFFQLGDPLGKEEGGVEFPLFDPSRPENHECGNQSKNDKGNDKEPPIIDQECPGPVDGTNRWLRFGDSFRR